jgi:hypothetical protein
MHSLELRTLGSAGRRIMMHVCRAPRPYSDYVVHASRGYQRTMTERRSGGRWAPASCAGRLRPAGCDPAELDSARGGISAGCLVPFLSGRTVRGGLADDSEGSAMSASPRLPLRVARLSLGRSPRHFWQPLALYRQREQPSGGSEPMSAFVSFVCEASNCRARFRVRSCATSTIR